MKKIIISIALSVFAVQSVFAAQVYTDYFLTMPQKLVSDFYPLHIKAEMDGEITVENGINIIIPTDYYLLWNTNDVTATGTAVNNGRVSTSVNEKYSSDYKVIYIPVLSDWSKNEEAIFSGIQVRAYNFSVPHSPLGIDTTGDKIADFFDVNEYRVTDDKTHADRTAPYPVTNLQHVTNEAKTQVKLTWVNPPDYDLTSIAVEKTLIRNGITKPTVDINSGALINELTDNQVLPGDKITYDIYASDIYNAGEKVTVTVDLSVTPPTTPVTPPVVVTPPTTPTTPKTELDQLKSLYAYYKVRYAIKCRAGVSLSDSNCLWAKIDLVYTQDLIGKTDVKTSLSANDIRLIKSRIKWPEARYQTNCVEAATPDKTCPALEKSLKRANYFIQ